MWPWILVDQWCFKDVASRNWRTGVRWKARSAEGSVPSRLLCVWMFLQWAVRRGSRSWQNYAVTSLVMCSVIACASRVPFIWRSWSVPWRVVLTTVSTLSMTWIEIEQTIPSFRAMRYNQASPRAHEPARRDQTRHDAASWPWTKVHLHPNTHLHIHLLFSLKNLLQHTKLDIFQQRSTLNVTKNIKPYEVCRRTRRSILIW